MELEIIFRSMWLVNDENGHMLYYAYACCHYHCFDLILVQAKNIMRALF